MSKPGDVGEGGAAGIPLPRLTKDSRRGEPPQRRRRSAAWCCSAASDSRVLAAAAPLPLAAVVNVKGPPPMLLLLLLRLRLLLGLVEKLEPKLPLRSERAVVELLEETLDGERALVDSFMLDKAVSWPFVASRFVSTDTNEYHMLYTDLRNGMTRRRGVIFSAMPTDKERRDAGGSVRKNISIIALAVMP